MNAEERTERIRKISDNEAPHNRVDVFWQDKQVPMDAFLIPLDDLIFNKYNDRIASYTLSLEKRGEVINPETTDGEKLIADLLWRSDVPANKKTMADLARKDQAQIGIVTKDGIIIDGNRRAMLLKKLGKRHFKAVILPVALEDNPEEIQRLETSYQMGADEKVGYGAIEKYLKVDKLSHLNISEKDIASYMNKTESEIKEIKKVFQTMNLYLDHFGYEGMYRQLDGREDQFISLTKWLKKFEDSESAAGFSGYNNNDVSNLNRIAFDYIRAQWEGKEFRNLAEGNKDSHFFGDKQIWNHFVSQHEEDIDPKSDDFDEKHPVDFEAEDIFAHLKARDHEWVKAVGGYMNGNMKLRSREVDDNKLRKEPIQLLERAFSSLSRIDIEGEAFAGDSIKEVVNKINHLTYEMKKALKNT